MVGENGRQRSFRVNTKPANTITFLIHCFGRSALSTTSGRGVDIDADTVTSRTLPRASESGPSSGDGPEEYGGLRNASGYGTMTRVQLNGPMALGPSGALACGSMLNLSHSSGVVLPCTTTRWKFATL
jgi:hypothetical protein